MKRGARKEYGGTVSAQPITLSLVRKGRLYGQWPQLYGFAGSQSSSYSEQARSLSSVARAQDAETFSLRLARETGAGRRIVLVIGFGPRIETPEAGVYEYAAR